MPILLGISLRLLIQSCPILINLNHIRIIQWLLFLNLFHQQQKSNRIREIVVLPFLRQFVSEVSRHSERTVDRRGHESNQRDWTECREDIVR